MNELTPQQIKNVEMLVDFMRDLNQQTMHKVWWLFIFGIVIVLSLISCVMWQMDRERKKTEEESEQRIRGIMEKLSGIYRKIEMEHEVTEEKIKKLTHSIANESQRMRERVKNPLEEIEVEERRFRRNQDNDND